MPNLQNDFSFLRSNIYTIHSFERNAVSCRTLLLAAERKEKVLVWGIMTLTELPEQHCYAVSSVS